MDTFIIKSIKEVVKNWYIPLVVGILFVLISILTFSSPLGSLLALSIFFALSFLFGGISEIIFSITNRNQMQNWGWSLTFGIITFIIGLALTIQPALSIEVMGFYIGFGVLFRSIASISFALDVKQYGSKQWIGLLVLGILGAIAAFILIWNPVFAGLSAVVLIAFSFLFVGLFSVLFSFELRKINKSAKTISAKLRTRHDELMKEIQAELQE